MEDYNFVTIFEGPILQCIMNYFNLSFFVTLGMLSPEMQEIARRIIRVRNNKLPADKQLLHLNEKFCVSVIAKELLKREGYHKVMVVTGGGTMYNESTVVISFDPVTNQYTVLSPMNQARRLHATAVLDGKLFVFGGYINRMSLSGVECLDLETGQRYEMPPMSAPRRNHGAAVLKGKIYVAGGYPLSRVGTLVESFDLDTNQLTAVTPMNTSRAWHGMVSANGMLFAVGGWNTQDRYLSSVECFDPSTRVWSNIAALSTARNSLAVAVLGDKLYAIGGIDSQYQYLSSVECLDLSVPNSQWTTVAPMTTPRCAMGAVVTGGKIYIAGGYGSSSIESWHVAVECFDPSDGPAGRWAVVSETSQFEGGARFSAC
jgi:N-acetylneuraminic acid mutarotase